MDVRGKQILAGVLMGLLLAGGGVAVTWAEERSVLAEAIELRQRGEFEKATSLLRHWLDETTATASAEERRAAEFEIERMRRIRLDYKRSADEVFEGIRKRVPDFSREEFERLERDGHFDVQVIDGRKMFMNSSVSNIFLRVPELRARDRSRKPDLTYRKLYDHARRVKEAHRLTRDFLVLPQDFMVTYTLTVKANAAPAGALVRCWMPYVRMFPFQSDAYILGTDPTDYLVAPPEYPHRTIYLEKRAEKDVPTRFQVRFIYRCWARASEVDPAKVQPYRKDGPEYAYYTADRKPHLDLSNELLRKLNAEIVGGETNPYLIARRIYDWIAQNTIYQYAREYSTLDNISHYVASRRAGDCGQHGMLFIALCRMNGIPARWQSGWESFDARGNNMHDWCEFYVEPYGWLPADPDMAVNLVHYAQDVLSETEIRELCDFMFGSMDHFRLATNCDFGMPLYPPKEDFRSETVDFQRGEVEADGKNLYFDQWNWNMEIEPIPPERAAELARQFVPAPTPSGPTPQEGESVTSGPVVAPSVPDHTTSGAQTSSDQTTSAPMP